METSVEVPAPSQLHAFADNLWTVEGPIVLDMGLKFTTRMIIAKLSDGSLWVDSPVPVSFATLKHITDLGPVQYLVAATPRHFWRLDGWHTLFPEAELWSCRITPMTLKKGTLPLTGILGDTPPSVWADDLDQLPFKGSPLVEEVLFYHKASGTVILDDLIQVNPMLEGSPIRNAIFRLDGAGYPEGGTAFDLRLAFTNRKLARQSLEQLLAWDFEKLIIAHGACIEKDAKAFVARAFRWLSR